jgi:hypothetical protein
MWDIDRQTRILSSHDNKGNSVICSKMDGTGGHFAKWNKLDKERKYDMFSLIRGSKKSWSNCRTDSNRNC